MTESGTPVVGDNIDKIKDQIKEAYDRIIELIDDRNETQASIGEQRAKLKALGINKKAFDDCRAYMGMDAEERRSFDISYALIRQALSAPMQMELFDDPAAALLADLAKATDDGPRE